MELTPSAGRAVETHIWQGLSDDSTAAVALQFSVFDGIQGSSYTARIKPATFYPPHIIEPCSPAACTHFVSFFWGIFQVNLNTKVLQTAPKRQSSNVGLQPSAESITWKELD